jgi:RNase adapter protein RapZ
VNDYQKNNKPKLVIVTGLSGAGHTSALRYLEDLGYDAVDNLPLALMPSLLQHSEHPKPLAIGIDSRSRDFNPSLIFELMARLKNELRYQPFLLFLDADTQALIHRFKANRRRHPTRQSQSMEEAIEDERVFFKSLKEMADLVVDTTTLSPHDLKNIIAGYCAINNEAHFNVTVVSFSYRQGIPREADLVFDVRFLRNPFYNVKLKSCTGLDKEVQDYIKSDPVYKSFMLHLQSLITILMPRYHQEGKVYLTIAMGCTGGQHRSVFIAEETKKMIEALGYLTHIKHREL